MKPLFCILFCLALCGCGIFSKEPYRDVNYYDFTCKTKNQKDLGIMVSELSADRPYSDKMVFRISDYRIEMDEYNRWSASPAELTRKYFAVAFENANPAKAPDYVFKAEIMQFEADLGRSKIRLMLQVSVSSAKSGNVLIHKVYSEDIPVEKVTGESFAAGIETCLDRIVVKLAKDMSGLPQ